MGMYRRFKRKNFMAIVIVVEDGTGKTNSNAYASIEYVKQYAIEHDVILPDDDDKIATMIIKSTDFIESKECEYSGERTNDLQALSWPRECAKVNCKKFPNNAIPKVLMDAQAALVLVVDSGLDLFTNYGPSDFVIEEKVGPITTKYSDPLEIGMTQHFGAAEALLNKLYNGGCSCSGGMLKTRRV